MITKKAKSQRWPIEYGPPFTKEERYKIQLQLKKLREQFYDNYSRKKIVTGGLTLSDIEVLLNLENPSSGELHLIHKVYIQTWMANHSTSFRYGRKS